MGKNLLRNANLDVVRGCAALMVVIYHIRLEQPFDALTALAPAKGWFSGVHLFFVLSGFLIGGLYWREQRVFGNVEVGRFWLRRWLRTIPPYLVALHVIFLGRYLQSGGSVTYDFKYLAFLQNYTGTNYFGVSWSLCIEEHFYLALPLFLGVFGLRRRAALAGLTLACLVPPFLRFAGVSNASPLHEYFTHMRFDGLILGVALAHVSEFSPNAWATLCRWARRFATPALAITVFYTPGLKLLHLDALSQQRYGDTALTLSYGVILAAVSMGPELPFGRSWVVRELAGSSYSLYMTHYMTIIALITARNRLGLQSVNPWLQFVILVTATLVVGFVFAKAFENTAIRLRDRLAPRRRLPPADSDPTRVVSSLPEGKRV